MRKKEEEEKDEELEDRDEGLLSSEPPQPRPVVP